MPRVLIFFSCLHELAAVVCVGQDQRLDPGESGAAWKVLQVGVVVGLDVDQALEALGGKVGKVVDADVEVFQLGQLGERVIVDCDDLVVRQVTKRQIEIETCQRCRILYDYELTALSSCPGLRNRPS